MSDQFVDRRLREATLELLGFLDEPASREFDTVTRLAARLLGCKIAMVSLIDRRSHHVLSVVGLGGAGLPRKDSFCARVVDEGEALIVEDTALDPRFSANPFVVGAPYVHFMPACRSSPERASAMRAASRSARSASWTTIPACSTKPRSPCCRTSPISPRL